MKHEEKDFLEGLKFGPTHRKVFGRETLDFHIENLTKATERIFFQKTETHRNLDENQKQVIKKLAQWLVGDLKPQAGILLCGAKGTGKTSIMQAFIAYYNHIYGKAIREIHSKMLPHEIKTKGVEYFYKRPIYIDDLGKESAITNDWGQKYDTWIDLFAMRYEFHSLTFATSNYAIDGQFKESYGEVINDRMKEHFNIIVLESKNSYRA